MEDKRTALTRKGYEDMQRELTDLLTVQRPALTERIRQAIQLGDLSENFDYQDAKRAQGMMEGRIQQLKDIINNATIIEPTGEAGNVDLGSTVVVKDLEEGFEEEYTIVGPAEADPVNGKISHESSVGGALIGRRAGETVEVSSPGGTFKYEIISVS